MPAKISDPITSSVASVDGCAVNWTKEAIEEFAEQLATRFGYVPGAPMSPLINQLGGQVVYQQPNDWLETESGSVDIRGVGDFTIYLSSFTSRVRDRFTLAHELGHYVLHSRLGKIAPLRIARHGSNRLEWEANWFAASFLMPSASVRQVWDETRDVLKIASRFDVSVEATRVRLNRLGCLR